MSVESRVVTMKFDNSGFERAAATTLGTLGKIKESLNFGNVAKAAFNQLGGVSGILQKMGLKNPFAQSQKGLQDLNAESGRFHLGAMSGAIQGVSKSWLAMTTVALTAISNITSRAVQAGLTWVKSFSFGPIMQGLEEYQTNLKSTQTIQANTDQPLKAVEKSLQQLNTYSDLTIYNFSEMARNIGTFTAAGVDLKTSTSAIKGIANMAALSGSSSEQAATAMYQLSQAISSGRVGLQDWNSVVNAGMGGKKLQNALAQTAIAMGQIDKQSVKLVGPMKKLTINGNSFRESIQSKPGEKPWLSSEVLVNTLATLDGRFSHAALAAERNADGTRKYSEAQIKAHIATARLNLEQKNGVKYTNEQFKALQHLSTQAFHSATEVKTLGQVFDVAKEAIGSGWAASFKSIFGNLNEAKKTFTGLSNYINGFIGDQALARNELLAAWKDMGGRNLAIGGIKTAFKSILTIIKPISQAFREIFPKKTAQDLINMTVSFRIFAQKLAVSAETGEKIKRTFAGVFAIFSIIGKVIAGVARGIGALFQAAGGGGGMLNFTAGLGDALVALNNFLAKSDVIGRFFTGLGNILAVPIKLLGNFASVIGGLFASFDTGSASKVTGAVDKFGNAVAPMEGLGQRLVSIFEAIGNVMGRAADLIGNALSHIGDLIANAITPDTFSKSLDVINTALLGGIVLMLKNFFSGKTSVDVTGGFFSKIGSTLDSATGALKNMQASIKADIIMKIAGALAILTASLFVLSTIPPAKLAKAMSAMTVGFGVLGGTMVALMTALGPMGAGQIYLISGAIAKLAGAMLLLSVSLKIMSSINLGDMLRGLLGMSIMLKIITKAMIPLAKGSPGMLKAAAAIVILGVAMNIMAVALKIFASMSWEEMAKGLAGVAGSLLILAGAMRLMPKGMFVQAAGILILSVALNALGTALKIFATMSWDEMIRGLSAVAGMLVVIGVAMRLMPKTLPVTAAGLVLVSVALNIMAGALKIMGGMGWEQIAKGMVVLAGSMLILAVGLNAIGIVGTIGAVGLMLTAAALAVLAPVLVTLGSLSWEAIAKGMVVLAGVFTILGLAGLILAPLTPVLIGLGAAMVLMGAGLALAGVGALAFATAFGVIVATGTAGIQVLAGMLGTVIKAIPKAMEAFAKGLIGFVQKIAQAGPKLVGSMAKIIGMMITAVIRNVPRMGKAFSTMINTGIRVIGNAVPKLINLGFKLIISFLNAINRNIGRITNIAASIIVKFLNGISRNIGKIIQAGVNLIIKFVNGVSRAIEKNSHAMGQAGARLGLAVVRGMASGISGAVGTIKDAAVNAAKDALNAAKDFLGIHSPSRLFRDEVGVHVPTGIAEGIDKSAHIPVRAVERMGNNALEAMKRTMAGVSDAMAVEGDMNPVISPVLDLSALTKEANKMSGILATVPVITPGVSYAQAVGISAEQQAAEEARSGGDSGGSHQENTFIQNNYSPKALSAVEVYRGGKSLFALAQEALKP